MTTTNRAIYRVAMRQLDDLDLIRWAAAEPNLSPLEAELLARLVEVSPLISYCKERDLSAAELIDVYEENEEIATEAGDDPEEIRAAFRALDFCRDQQGWNAPIYGLLQLRNRWADVDQDPPARVGSSAVVLDAEDFDHLLTLLNRLDNDFYNAVSD